MKIFGLIVGDKFIYSRSRYDYKTYSNENGSCFIDGGQPSPRNCIRTGGNILYRATWVEIKDLTLAKLYNDWNLNKNKLGEINIKKVKILDSKDFPDTTSEEWQSQNLMWGTNGKSGKEPTVYKMIHELETDHLEAILATQFQISQFQISPLYKKVIKNILRERKEK